MTAEATWFGSPDRPLAGWLHVPAGDRARGGVVLCPPVGMEYVNSHRTLRTLAEQLTERGIAVLRFDYDGTGDSAGDDTDPGRVAAWSGSIAAAVGALRSVVGDRPLAALGLRLGASLLAARLASSDGAALRLCGVVLWDAPGSGRRFVRAQRSLGRVIGGVAQPDGAVDAPGVRYSAETVADLSASDLPDLGALPVDRILVLSRTPEDAPPPDATRGEHALAAGMPQLLDVSPLNALVPTGAVAAAVDWLDALLPPELAAVQAHRQVEATVSPGVAERHLRLGPVGLYGIETAPTRPLEDARTVVLLNTGADHHIGPARMWVELAREWAGRGVRTVRVDISGIGDSPLRDAADPDVMYAPYAVQDVREVLAGLRGEAAPVLVGLCSGGHLAIQVAAEVPSASAVAMNLTTTQTVAPACIGPDLDLQLGRPWPRRVLRALGMPDAGRRLLVWVEQLTVRMPPMLWALLVRLRVVLSPSSGLEALEGTDATLILGPEDSAGFLTRGRRELDRARDRGLEVVVTRDLDHMPMVASHREHAKALFSEHVLRRVAPDERVTPAL